MILGILTAILYLIFTFFSWTLFFREELEVIVFSLIFPQYGAFLNTSRQFLLGIGLNSWLNAIFALVIIIFFLGYFLAIKKKPKARLVIIFAAIFQIITFFSYPIFSTDIYDYILNSKVAVEYKQNVWLISPKEVVSKDDVFYTLGRWRNQPSPYGITHHWIYNSVNRLFNRDLVSLIINFKLVSLTFGLLLISLVYKLLKNYYPDQISRGLVLIFWNPLFVWDVSSSAHNNVIMIFLLLLSLLFYKRKQFIFGGLALAAATQMKYISAILAMFYIFSFIRDRKFKNLLLFSVPYILLNLFGLWQMGREAVVYLFAVGTGSYYYWQTPHFLIHKIFPDEKIFFFAVFILFVLIQLFRNFRKGIDPIVLYLQTLLFYLLFITSFYWNWYVLWLLPFIIFISWGKLAKVIILLTFTSSLAHPAYWLFLRFYPYELLTHIVLYLLIAGPPVLCYFLHDRIFKKT